MKKQAIKNEIQTKLNELTYGRFKDSSWEGITKIRDGLQKIEDGHKDIKMQWFMTGSEYVVVDNVPTRKRWTFEVEFFNNKNNKTTFYGTIVAGGCGSVEDPLSIYDVVAYIS